MAQKNTDTHTIYDDHTIGTVKIADEVIAAIAALAATEAEGVASLGGGITHQKAARAGARALSRGIKTEIKDGTVSVRIILVMQYGASIPQTTRAVQEKVKSTLELMTGLTVGNIDVSVASVAAEPEKA